MVKVLGLGDNVCDVYLHTDTMYPGGQALNFAVYARMLGAESEFLGSTVRMRWRPTCWQRWTLRELGIPTAG